MYLYIKKKHYKLSHFGILWIEMTGKIIIHQSLGHWKEKCAI